MKLNTKTRYGLRALLEIALTSNEQGILQKDISASQGISNKYLDQIIAELKSADLIENVAGKKSGYKLKNLPEEITIYNIYKAFNPSLKLVDCVCSNECENENSCAAQHIWCGLNENIVAYLQAKTLADLVLEHKRLQSKENTFMFYI